MKRSATLKRTAFRPKPRRQHQPGVYGPYHRWIASKPCTLWLLGKSHACNVRVDGHHLRTIGAGGKDYGNEVPLCLFAHAEVHTSGRTRFEAKYGIDLGNIAEYLRVTWDTMHHTGT